MSFDPFEYQKKMVQEWEKNLAKYMDKTMRDPGFMQLVSRNLGTSLDVQKVVKDQMQKGLAGLSIPTSEDLKKVFTVLNRVESLLLDLEERVTDLEGKNGKSSPAPEAASSAGAANSADAGTGRVAPKRKKAAAR
jgi:BMFP domain-containing protein YqiC